MITDDFVAVIDGSTSKSPVHIADNCSNGHYCMMLISEFICHADKSTDVETFCRELTDFISSRYDGLDMRRLEDNPEERLTASCIVYSRYHRQIWMIGDCQCLVDGQHYDNPKPGEAISAEKRATIIRSLIANGQATVDSLRSNDTARQAIIPEMIKTMRDQNKSYAVVDGFPIPMRHVRIITLTTAPHSIVLASDGYPFLLPTLVESEAALLHQLSEDPLNAYLFKATKAFLKDNNSFDDRTYIRFEI